MAERLKTVHTLRAAMQSAAAILLQREGAQDQTVEAHLPEGFVLPDAWLAKANRYATAGPLIKMMARHMVDGQGWEARFREAPMYQSEFDRKMSPPDAQVLAGTRRLFYNTAVQFKAAHGAHTGLMQKYSELSGGLDVDAYITSGEGLVAGGGDYPYGIYEYVKIANELIEADKGLSQLSPEGRRDFAHQLLPVAMGRQASMHQDDFLATPTLSDVHEAGGVELKQVRDSSYRLSTGGAISAAAAGNGAHEVPALVCPAIMEFPDEPETAFETFVHAGINYAYDLGVFGNPPQLPEHPGSSM
jgi:hypothetical protein